MDPARTNLSVTLQRSLEADGTQLSNIRGEAHEKVGSVDVRGRYFEDLLLRALALFRPSTKAEWNCLCHPNHVSHKFFVLTMGFAVHFRFSIGSPELLGGLPQNQPDVVSPSSVLHGDLAAHPARLRSTARLSVSQRSDSLATRRPLDQRPRSMSVSSRLVMK